MNPINCIFIDDESSARKTLKSIIREFFPELRVVAEAESPREGVQVIRKHAPDLVFLDVELQYGTGFDVLEQLPEVNFQVIFVTAYEQYARRSFRVAALDYLLKPVRISEMKEAIARFRERTASHFPGSAYRKVREEFFDPAPGAKLILPESNGFFIVNVEEIIRCESARNYTIFHLSNATQRVVAKTLKDYEEILLEYGFFRVHKSHLISLNGVRHISRGKQAEIEMINGDRIPISRERKDAFLDQFMR
ncbi:MAG: LytTR family DNA-binding domain-containing protein [Bacteroidota bacterium]